MGDLMQGELKSKIQGVRIIELKQIADERGTLLHMVRSGSPFFTNFGEIYFSEVYPGIIKAWKRHRLMTQHFAVPIGRIHIVIYDDRLGYSSKGNIEELVLGRPDRYLLLQVPPLLWYGFKGIAETPSILANCADMPHNPEESEQKDLWDNYIPYKW
ncbi:dTDP-4-dehydrorhamnose 3,5-epimerase [Thermodesulfobacteriota bacterium]